MPSPSANPTPITPPRVPLIDQRTGLIDRAWYMFFLSLFNAAQTALDAQDLGPSAESLVASYEAALRTLEQTVATAPAAQAANLQLQIDALRQEVETTPRPALGSMAPLQQNAVPWLTFSTAPDVVSTAVGTIAWDGGTTLGVQMTSNIVGRVNESEFIYVKAASPIAKGQVCMHTGAVGASGTLLAAPAIAGGVVTGWDIIGIAAESIATNGFGLIQSYGVLRNVNTSGFADGDTLYWDPAVAGGYTLTKPSAPNVKTLVGEVLNGGSAGGGSILVRLFPGSELGGTDSNVQFSALANKDIIQYDSALGYWKNAAASNSTTLPSAIIPGASPFTYQNTSAYPVDVIVSGGGVSQLQFSRDNVTYYDTGSYYGMFTLSPNDWLRVTYTAAPTMTLIPR